MPTGGGAEYAGWRLGPAPSWRRSVSGHAGACRLTLFRTDWHRGGPDGVGMSVALVALRRFAALRLGTPHHAAHPRLSQPSPLGPHVPAAAAPDVPARRRLAGGVHGRAGRR